jgi:hypothetical protein
MYVPLIYTHLASGVSFIRSNNVLLTHHGLLIQPTVNNLGSASPAASLAAPPCGCRSKWQLAWQRVFQATDWRALAGQLTAAATPDAWEVSLQGTPLCQVGHVRCVVLVGRLLGAYLC